MADETRDFRIRVTMDSKDAERQTGRLTGSFTELNQATELAEKAVRGVSAAFGATFQALERAQVVEGVAKGFQNLQQQAGLLADNSLQKLRGATQGLVSDFELMQKANQAAQLGLDVKQLDIYAEAALKLGAAVGRDAASAFDDLITGVGRASPLILDNLGITIKMSEAYQRQAEILGTTVEALTEKEKADAFQAAALDKIIEKSSKLTDVQINAGQAYTQVKVATQNATDAFAEAVGQNEALSEALQELAVQLSQIDWATFGEALATAVSVVVRAVNAFFDLAEAIQLVYNQNLLIKGVIQDSSLALIREATSVEAVNSQLDIQRRLLADVNLKLFEKQKVTIGGIEIIDAETQALKEQDAAIREVITAGELQIARLEALASVGGTISTGVEEIVQKRAAIENSDEVKRAIDETADYRNDKFQQSADFFSDALYNAMTGAAFDAEDIFKRVFAGIAGGFLSQLTGGFGAGLGTPQGIGQVIGASILGGGPGIGSLGGGLGGIFGGLGQSAAGGFVGAGAAGVPGAISGGAGGFIPGGIFGQGGFFGAGGAGLSALGIGAGAFVGAQQFSGISNIFSGNKPSILEQAALAPLTGGFSFLAGPLSDVFGSGKDPDQQARDAAFQAIFGGDGGRQFTTVGGSSFNIREQPFNVETGGLAQEAISLVTGLGSLLGGGDGKLKDDITGIFANTIAQAENFNEAILNGQALLGELGFSAQDAKNELTALFLDGQVGLEEFGAGIQGFNILATDNLVGENSVADALSILADNLGPNGKPRVAIRALELAFSELRERGIEETDEIRGYLIDRFGPEIADAFDRLAASGINSFTDFANLSADQIFALFSQIASVSEDIEAAIGGSFENAADRGKSALSSLISKIGELSGAAGSINAGGGNLVQAPLQNTGPLAGGVDPRTGQKKVSLDRKLGVN